MVLQVCTTKLSPGTKRLHAWAAVFVLFFMAGSPAFAANCADPQTQIDMNRCADEAFQAADKRLNAVYQTALRKQKAADAAKIEDFRNIQRAWIKYRDLHCGYASAVYEGGSMAPGVHSACMEKLTEQRIEDIPSLFAQWE